MSAHISMIISDGCHKTQGPYNNYEIGGPSYYSNIIPSLTFKVDFTSLHIQAKFTTAAPQILNTMDYLTGIQETPVQKLRAPGTQLRLAHVYVYGAIASYSYSIYGYSNRTSIPAQLLSVRKDSAYKSNKKEDLCSGYNLIPAVLPAIFLHGPG